MACTGGRRTSAEKASPFLDTGGAHLEVPPQRGHGTGSLRQAAAGRAFGQGALALLGGGSLEIGQQRQELRGAIEVPCPPGSHL